MYLQYCQHDVFLPREVGGSFGDEVLVAKTESNSVSQNNSLVRLEGDHLGCKCQWLLCVGTVSTRKPVQVNVLLSSGKGKGIGAATVPRIPKDFLLWRQRSSCTDISCTNKIFRTSRVKNRKENECMQGDKCSLNKTRYEVNLLQVQKMSLSSSTGKNSGIFRSYWWWTMADETTIQKAGTSTL
jgi:hypothetical protein